MRSRVNLSRWLVAGAVLAAAIPGAAFGSAQPQAPVRTLRPALVSSASNKSEQVPGIVLVRFKDASAAAVRRTLGTSGLSVSALVQAPKARLAAVHVPRGITNESFASRLSKDPNVAAAAPDFERHVLAYTPPNDPAYNDSTGWSGGTDTSTAFGKSWWLRAGGVNAAAAWQHGFSDPAPKNFPVRTGSGTFKVAVLDTGFYMTHPDKGPNIVAGIDEFDHVGPGGELVTDYDVTPPAAGGTYGLPIEIVSHGTCTAGEVAAATNNGVGVASVGYDAKVVVYKVMGPDGTIPDLALAKGIDDATAAGCKVISMSLGGSDDSSVIQAAVNYAWSHGVVILAASGNGVDSQGNHDFHVQYPAADDNVVGVGSYGYHAGRFRSSFTSYLLNPPPAKQNGVDILAPGELVWGLINPGYVQTDINGDPIGPAGYAFWDGTSMATPAAAGALAHLWRYEPSFTNAQIVDYLEQHAASPGGSVPSVDYGWGYLDMSLVMDGYMSDYPYLAAPALTTPSTMPAGPADITWDPVAGSSVSYVVSVDGSAVQTTTGTSAPVTLAQGLHSIAVQATSPYNWYDASSTATATVFAGTTAGATPPGRWAGYPPTGWSQSQTAHVTIQSRDASMGLVLGTAQYSYSSDAGADWSAWLPATFSYVGAPTATQTISADVPFGHDSDTDDLVQFRVANAASLVGTSPVFAVKVDSTPPAGDFVLASGDTTVTTQTVPVHSSVTDVHSIQMRFSVDGGASWQTTWTPYAADTTVTLTAGRGTKTVIGQFRDVAGNVLTTPPHTTHLATPFLMTRIAGYNREDTAIRTSQAHFAAGTAGTVIIATANNFADALSASALAGSYSAPLLLTPTASLFSEIPAEIARLHATHAIIVGGEPVVSAAVFNDLAALPGMSVRRIKGSDRYATSAAIATEVKSHELSLGHTFANEAFIARGDVYPDALAASPLAYEGRVPILLVKPTSIPSVITTELAALMPNVATAHLVVCGGTGAVSTGVTNPLTAGHRRWTRVGSGAGGTRYDTAVALASYGVSRGWASWRFVGIATGQNFPDALGGGVAAGRMGGLVLLTTQASASPAAVTALWLQTNLVSELDVFGGTSVVSATAYNTIHGLF